MQLIKNGDLEYYKFDKFNDLKHCFSTRNGGVSQGVCSSMNLGFNNDKKENVLKNYEIICKAIGCNYKNVVFTKQIHTDNILRVTKKDIGTGIFNINEHSGYDAMICNEKDVVLTGFSADCVLIYLYDSKKRAVGICHSGWRGTVLAIGAKVVNKMIEEFGSDSNDIVCGISPAIGSCCFQVEKPVVDEFNNAFDWANKYISNDEKNAGKYYIDLHSINEEILVKAGIKRSNIENSRLCTKCNPDRFFTHRLMGSNRGTLAGLISL